MHIVCVYVCMCACTHVCIRVVYMCIHACLFVCIIHHECMSMCLSGRICVVSSRYTSNHNPDIFCCVTLPCNSTIIITIMLHMYIHSAILLYIYSLFYHCLMPKCDECDEHLSMFAAYGHPCIRYVIF